jgi:hypothetical protein
MTEKNSSQAKPSSNALQLLKQSLNRLVAQLDAIPVEQWQIKPHGGGWSVGEIVHHLVLVEVQELQELKDVVEGRQESMVVNSATKPDLAHLRNPSPKHHTIAAFEPTAGIPAKYLLDGLRRARKETIAYAQKVGKDRLSRIGMNAPWVKGVNGGEFLECLGYHMERHTEQIINIFSVKK